MLYRKIEEKIVNWIHNSNKALLIDGARQVGKTFIIRTVLNKEKCDYVEFNLIKMPKLVNLLSSVETIEELVTSLSLFTNKKIKKGETFIFIDEIQEFKDIMTKIKFWVDEESFRFVFSGSLLGVELKNLKSAPVGYLTTYKMYPLDFEEFLQLYNFNKELKEMLYNSFVNCIPVNETVHLRLMKIFYTYLIVGGMPAAVQKFQETSNLEDVVNEHLDIIEQYKKDFTRYEEEKKKIYISRVFDLIPANLNEPNKRFNFVNVNNKSRFSKIEENFIWLELAGVALPVYNTSVPTIPLCLNEKNSLFKLFLSDVGILTTKFGRTAKIQILDNGQDINNGALYENVVAQELKAHGFQLYYYNSKKYGELDFVIEYKGKVLPIEVKSGKDYTRHSALNNVMEISDYSINKAFVFTNYNIKVDGKLVYYPIYMLMFLQNDDKCPKIEIDSLNLSNIVKLES